MKPSNLKAEIKSRHVNKNSRAVYAVGSPGIGKTEIAAQVARELGIGFKCIHAPMMQPEDYGFPVISADKRDVSFVASREKFPFVTSDCEESGILLIDELPQCDNSAQKVLANLIQAREIHGISLKPNWSIVATGNSTADRSGANRILGHLADRVTEIDLEVSVDDWVQWALDNSIKTEVISFVRFRPELLNKYDAHARKSPTPRGWSQGVNRSLGVTDAEFEVFKGDVGEGASAEFCAFLKVYRHLPSVDAILLDAKNAEVPKEPAIQYALCGALSNRAAPDNFGRIMEYMKRLPEEFSVLVVRDSLRRCKEIQTTKDFIIWASGDGAKLLS